MVVSTVTKKKIALKPYQTVFAKSNISLMPFNKKIAKN